MEKILKINQIFSRFLFTSETICHVLMFSLFLKGVDVYTWSQGANGEIMY